MWIQYNFLDRKKFGKMPTTDSKAKESRGKRGNLVQSKEIEKQSELARGLNHPRPNKTAMSGRKNCGVRAEEKSGGDELSTFRK